MTGCRRAGVAACALAVACAAPPVNAFSPPQPGHEVIATFTDTVDVFRVVPADSVAAEGLALLHDLLRPAGDAGRRDAEAALRGALAAIPEAVRPRPDSVPEGLAVVAGRLSRRGPATRMTMVRADRIGIDDVRADTVVRALPSDSLGVSERWLVLVVRARAFLDPALGRRPDGR